MTTKQINRIQNLVILLLTLSAFSLFASLPIFGAFSDRSLFELIHDRVRRESVVAESSDTRLAPLAFPVRMVYSNDFARFGADSLTTLSDEFERAGTYLGEAIGSANGAETVREAAFLIALRGEGLYFDFTTSLPLSALADLLGVTAPEIGLSDVRRALLSPAESGDAVLYVQDGAGVHYRFNTSASSSALVEFLASQGGNGVDFAFMLGAEYAQLSPYTLVLSDPSPRVTLRSANALALGEDTFLRRAEFNAHTENRFTESSGTVIVREVSSTLYLRPDGTVDYQGAAAAPDSIYYVAAAEAGAPTRSEAAAAAQLLALTLLQDFLGDAALYLSDIAEGDGTYDIAFDLMADGTPIRFSDGSHAAVVTVTGQSITAFTLKARQYTLTEETPLLLPLAQAAAIARLWDGAELVVAYIDAGAETVAPAWIAE